MRLHQSMEGTPYLANRIMAVVGSMYAWAVRRALLPDGCNPVRRIERYPETHRERFLTRQELDRLGTALRLGETVGFVRPPRNDKRAPKADICDKVSIYATAAIRLLLFTGARVGEVLSLQWSHVDIEREILLLPDSKTGAKIVHLNAPALAVLPALPRVKGNPGKPSPASSKRAGRPIPQGPSVSPARERRQTSLVPADIDLRHTSSQRPRRGTDLLAGHRQAAGPHSGGHHGALCSPCRRSRSSRFAFDCKHNFERDGRVDAERRSRNR